MFSPHTLCRSAVTAGVILTSTWADAQTSTSASATNSPFAPELKEFVENFKPNTRATAYTQRQALSPAESLSRLDPAPGYKVELAANEPDVRQPLDLQFDHRGRLWVVQYIQYPYPAGLKILDVGNQFHATYDKVPPPPPHQDPTQLGFAIKQGDQGAFVCWRA